MSIFPCKPSSRKYSETFDCIFCAFALIRNASTVVHFTPNSLFLFTGFSGLPPLLFVPTLPISISLQLLIFECDSMRKALPNPTDEGSQQFWYNQNIAGSLKLKAS